MRLVDCIRDRKNLLVQNRADYLRGLSVWLLVKQPEKNKMNIMSDKIVVNPCAARTVI